MNWNTLHRLLPALKARRRALVPLLVVVLLTPIGVIPQAQTASAQTSDCDVTSCPPPDLLNLNQPLYAPTAVQMSSLEDLENQAVNNIIGAYGLASDTDAVMSWGAPTPTPNCTRCCCRPPRPPLAPLARRQGRGAARPTSRTRSTG